VPKSAAPPFATLLLVREVDLKIDPVAVLKRWPRGIELAAVIAGDGRARYSVFGVPARMCGDVREIFASASTRPIAAATSHAPDSRLPFESGWILSIAYEYGYELDATGVKHSFAATSAKATTENTLPDHHHAGVISDDIGNDKVIGARLDAALVHDAVRGMWWRTGGECARLDGAVDILCSHQHNHENEHACRQRNQVEYNINNQKIAECKSCITRAGQLDYICEEPVPLITAADYGDRVRRALSYIREGDVYQVNLTHPLVGDFSGCALSWFADRCEHARPRYGCYVTHPGGVIASLSPELLLKYDAHTRRIITQPMKGTRVYGADAERELRESGKDGAELAMIVDLLRNDLGRICVLGSVRVDEALTIEEHGRGRLLQATATVSGKVAQGTGLLDVFHACFPGGSVTGAPKSRAMQIIGELEARPRGHYCGCAGYIADGGDAQLNITIRTAQLRGLKHNNDNVHALKAGAQIIYYVGAGIVAESEPSAEWEETLAKAAPLHPS
jgi:anthranilate/para-aminobenzoate synthase component I